MVELREHFAGEADLAGLVRRTRPNLEKTIAEERYMAHTTYPLFARRAAAVGDRQVARLFVRNGRDDANHARAFAQALNHLPVS
ncbi:ferritin family protein [Streptomyces sp. M19]